MIDPRSGAARLLLHGEELTVFLDESGQRQACLVEERRVTQPGVTPRRRELWAGAVPTP